ncbi:hypothetical protein BLX87_15745 [Bacillus sp. VT-16-64]|nr:hypothetical protein BLX87_15745 [Bacillus sp. VT-16-64]
MNETMSRRPLLQNAYIGLGFIFLVCLLIQFLLAGLSIFKDPATWAAHRNFVHLFGYTLPILMIICSMIGRFFGLIYKELLSIFLLIFLMYLTANLGWKVGWLGALHPVVGLLLMCVTGVGLVKVYKRDGQKTDKKVENKKRGLISLVLIGAVGGFVAGLLLSNIVGVIGVILFEKAIGVQFLPIYLAVISSIMVPVLKYRRE